ncbi:twin-arginine translocase TatA/TatE family subunit [Acetobacteraceae bacterium]|nr:twin-arginine translocase TatA/TatE family subunit [Acetobacteraceae bacterium]
MGSMSITHWIILGVIVLILFGGSGKISSMMGDLAKGLKTFKKSMAEEDEPDSKASASIAHKDGQDVSMASSRTAAPAEQSRKD